jgi:hypothetical protein
VPAFDLASNVHHYVQLAATDSKLITKPYMRVRHQFPNASQIALPKGVGGLLHAKIFGYYMPAALAHNFR